jgi:hypothetical protein
MALTRITDKQVTFKLDVKNYTWAGFFAVWQAGGAATTDTQRVMANDGATIARNNFTTGSQILHVDGTYSIDAARILRVSGTSDTSPTNLGLSLTEEESKPLAGHTVCAQFHAKKSATWTGTTINARIQYSIEQQQPIISADGTYTSGHTVAAQQNIALTTACNAEDAPYYFSAAIPSNAVNVALVITVPWSGTAGNSDYIEIESVALVIGTTAKAVERPSFSELFQLAKTRRQTSYPYGAPRGAVTEQGSLSLIAASTAANYAFIGDVRFNPPMANTPQFLFQNTLSGTESRLTDTVTQTSINGFAFNLTNAGVSITNNAAVTDGRRYLCHWTAISLV